MFKYSCSIFLLALSLQLNAQGRITTDSSRLNFLPTGIRFGTDLLAIGKGIKTDYFKGWEINADADFFRRYYLAVDYGSWTTNYTLDNGTYSSDGRYFRVGVDINFLKKDPERNMFFLGFRRGHTNYTDYSDYSYTDDVFQVVNVHVSNPNPVANWNELTTGLRVRVWKFLWLGATGRLKFAYSGHNQWNLLSYDVPGYGRTFKNNWWGSITSCLSGSR
ncbi:MAG: DUF6048 family protein [Bacteroidota bacterium]